MSKTGYWILRSEQRLLTLVDTVFPFGPAGAFGDPDNALYVGELHGQPCHAVDLAELPEMPGAEPTPLRAIFQLAGPEIFALAGRATQLLDWQANHRFCG